MLVITMPQSERSSIIKQLMKWLATQENGTTVSAILTHVKWEITEGGASDATIKKYIEDLQKAGHIVYKHPFWKVSAHGREWLERHQI
jgi:putative NADPH-quinone reductase